uniref:Uncharacterized protein n=1 Tax=Amphimedon queenslandica TaxID=400682 RepID=A0A1X7TNG0_AMPQE
TAEVRRGLNFEVDELKSDLCYLKTKLVEENKKEKEKFQESIKSLNTRIRQHKKLK